MADFTEDHPHYVEMYDVSRERQYTYAELRGMPVDDLVYLSGHQPPMHADLAEGQRIKLQGNGIRARDELTRRPQAEQLVALQASTAESRRLVRATWGLAIVTIIVALATIVAALIASSR